MTERRASTEEKVLSPASKFAKPDDIVRDKELSQREKSEALNTWEQDARQLMTASNEGMPGPKEGLSPKDHHRLGEVVRAKDDIGGGKPSGPGVASAPNSLAPGKDPVSAAAAESMDQAAGIIASSMTYQTKTFAAGLESIARRNPLAALAGAVVVGTLIGIMVRRNV